LFAVYITKISPAKQFLISFLEPGFQLLKNLTAELAEHALCALCLLFVHPAAFNPEESKGQGEAISKK